MYPLGDESEVSGSLCSYHSDSTSPWWRKIGAQLRFHHCHRVTKRFSLLNKIKS